MALFPIEMSLLLWFCISISILANWKTFKKSRIKFIQELPSFLTYQTEKCQDSCLANTHKQVIFLVLQHNTQAALQDFGVERPKASPHS
jgi:hypothetical protein